MNELYKLKAQLKKVQKEFEQYKKESIRWCWEDFTYRAEEIGYKCSKKKAQELVEQMIRKHDANLGINWYTLDYYIETNCKKISKKIK